ncbi:hypothetical protein [Paraliomyxa miuraensis]|uniref:hypothetical protein n=1 Tax=Paraliomyxa miuraensis TaxID=376150 RepID=UPI00224E9C45|nr:hypothetical protein [Paraliomyxa miuraensis]MCX4242140.1 hypothetical protein [Paraliomyxa miuraensis]
MLRFVLVNGAAIGLGAIVSTSCVDVDYPLVAFRCNPQQESNCPDTHFCCSDDPAAPMGAKPNYMGKNIDGGEDPYFSGMNNALSTSGMCVRTADIAGQGLIELAAANCPIPCNPTWEADWINDVCGESRVCCQTVELEAKDCVQGSDGVRPVNGGDIGTLSQWRPGDHSTHQDPNGSSCLALAGGNSGSAVFQDCVRQLSVADQRGFCMALGAGQVCPTKAPGYIDACTALGGAPPA